MLKSSGEPDLTVPTRPHPGRTHGLSRSYGHSRTPPVTPGRCSSMRPQRVKPAAPANAEASAPAGVSAESHRSPDTRPAKARRWTGPAAVAAVCTGLPTFLGPYRGCPARCAFLRTSCVASWLDSTRVRALLAQPLLLQLEGLAQGRAMAEPTQRSPRPECLIQLSAPDSWHLSTPSSRNPHQSYIRRSPAASHQRSDCCRGQDTAFRQTTSSRQGHASELSAPQRD